MPIDPRTASDLEASELACDGPLARDAQQLSVLLDRTARSVDEHLAAVPELPVAPQRPVDPSEVREWLASTYDFEHPHAAEDVVRDVLARLAQWTVHTTHPRYFGLFNPAPAAAGIAGELLAAGVNPQLAAWSHAPEAWHRSKAEAHLAGHPTRVFGVGRPV
jgi:aromatic-L-amino-acid decarboxylase